MDLNDLLAEVEGIGNDQFIPSKTVHQPGQPPQLAGSEPVFTGKETPFVSPTSPPARQPRVEAPATSPASILPLGLIADVELELSAELGQATLPLKDVMCLRPGSQFTLERRLEDAMKIFVNGQQVALGEPLIVDGYLAVKIIKLLAPDNGAW